MNSKLSANNVKFYFISNIRKGSVVFKEGAYSLIWIGCIVNYKNGFEDFFLLIVMTSLVSVSWLGIYVTFNVAALSLHHQGS